MDDSFAKSIQKSRTIKALPRDMIVPKAERDFYYQHFTLKVKSLAEYIDIISRINQAIKRTTIADMLVFRGHSDASGNYQLIPTIGRKRPGIEGAENRMVSEMISLRPEEFSSIHTNFDLLSKLQHFGLPTRLLDFTYNPLIALYFACNEKQKRDGRVICTYDTSDSALMGTVEQICGLYKYNDYNAISLDRIVGGVSQLRKYALYTKGLLMAKPKYSNERIKHQSAVFMIFPNAVYDCRSRMVVLARKNKTDEEEYRIGFSINKIEKRRLESIRNEPEIYDNSFCVTSDTLHKLFKYYDNKYTDFFNETEYKITDKYYYLFQDRFSICDEIQKLPSDIISNSFFSILIENRNKKQIIKELESIGINKAFVFPELEYTAETVKNRLFKEES